MGSTADLVVAYDGPALQDHKIDVRDLAPALLGIGELFEEANRILNGDRAEIRTRVKATSEGCFAINLEFVQSFARQLQGFLTGEHVTAAINLRELLGLGGVAGTGLLAAIRFLKNRRAKKLEKNDSVVLQIEGEELRVSKKVVSLIEDVQVRRAVRRMLEPLDRPGIDSFEVRETRRRRVHQVVRIEKEELSYFNIPDGVPFEVLPERRWTSAFTIVSLTFKEDNKWRLSDGQSQINATISDRAFLKRVNEGLPFAKGDVLVCEIISRQSHTSEGLKTEYEVIRVEEHRPAPRQIKMFR